MSAQRGEEKINNAQYQNCMLRQLYHRARRMKNQYFNLTAANNAPHYALPNNNAYYNSNYST